MLQKYSKLDPTSAEGTTVLSTHFISQSSPDIRKKQKKAEGPQTPQRDLLNLAFKIFNNREEQAKLEKAQGDQAKYHLFSHCHTSLQASTNQKKKKEASWALLQMQRRRLLGLLLPKAKAPSRSMSQLWHKGTLEGRLPKSPSRDPDIPS